MKAPSPFHTIIEPFRIKSVEPVKFTTAEERLGKLAAAGWNPFLLRAAECLTTGGARVSVRRKWYFSRRGGARA
jgi:tryptophanase